MTNTAAACRQYLYFAYHRARGSHVGERYHEAIAYDWQRDPIATVRTRLASLLAHSRVHVPYYAALMEQPHTVDALTELGGLPVLTKQIIREKTDDLTSDDLGQRHWNKNTTGGSTGQPVTLIQDRDYRDQVVAVQMMFFAWHGRALGEPMVYLWGSDRDVQEGSVGVKMSVVNALTRTTYLNAFKMSTDHMRRYIDLLNQHPPRLIAAFTQAAYDLARFAEQEGLPVVPQHAIDTSSGTLYPFMREKIGQVFQCPVYDRYGCREVGDIACECPEGGRLHIAPWANYVEIVDDEGTPVPAGEEGSIVVTSLLNYAMPLVRYSLGDRGVLAAETECACGRRSQILDRIVGRTIDSFIKEDGSIVHGAYFMHALYSSPWIWTFQVVQEDYRHIVYTIVRTDDDDHTDDLETIRTKCRQAMGDDCEIEFRFVDEIAPSPSGKFNYTRSDVRH